MLCVFDFQDLFTSGSFHRSTEHSCEYQCNHLIFSQNGAFAFNVCKHRSRDAQGKDQKKKTVCLHHAVELSVHNQLTEI